MVADEINDVRFDSKTNSRTLLLVRPVPDGLPFRTRFFADEHIVAAIFGVHRRRGSDVEFVVGGPTHDIAGILGIDLFLARGKRNPVHIEHGLVAFIQSHQDCVRMFFVEVHTLCAHRGTESGRGFCRW